MNSTQRSARSFIRLEIRFLTVSLARAISGANAPPDSPIRDDRSARVRGTRERAPSTCPHAARLAGRNRPSR
jgi:hypothetical protein